MPLHLYRSNSLDELLHALCARLARFPARCPDPFAEIPIVTGSRGMQRWLRHGIATHRGIAARLAFPFPRPALDGAAAALLPGIEAPEPFWSRTEVADPWDPAPLAWLLLELIRTRLADPGSAAAFARVRAYLQRSGSPPPESVGARELFFAREVADSLDALVRQRPEVAARWLDDEGGPDSPVPERDRWLACLLRDVRERIGRPCGAERFAALHAAMTGAAPPDRAGELHVFGLSSLPLHELRLLGLVSRAPSLHVHLYLLAPSRVWIGDQRGRAALARELARLRAEPLPEGDPADPVLTAELARRARVERHLIDRVQAANPLLADLGRPSRDMQALLEEFVTYREPAGPGGADGLWRTPAGDSVLARVQRDLLDARAPDEEGADRAIADDDRSLTFHPCFGPLRQVESLRLRLLDAFNRDKTLHPREVLVMTPEIATYAPLVAAVFGQEGLGAERSFTHRDGTTGRARKLPAIPVDIADLGLRATNGVADVLLTVLEMADARLTLPSLLALLAKPAVGLRFALSVADVGELRRLLVGAGFRWGRDAADRGRVGQPERHQNTLAFAMERIALGALFPDEIDLDDEPAGQRVLESSVASEAAVAGRDFVPFDAFSVHGQSLFGRLLAFESALLHHLGALARPASIGGWVARCKAVVDDLAATSDATAWLEGRVLDELDGLKGGCEVARGGDRSTWPTIDLAAFRTLVAGAFELSRRGDRPIGGGVSVCSMEPMRSVPFRVVALLGMDDGAFPRASRHRAWDPMGRGRRAGEHERRDIDRQLLLESLLSAEQGLLVYWSGFDVHTGESRPAAVPIRELMDAIDARFDPPPGAEGATASAALTVREPLQPWSRAVFLPGEGRQGPGYDRPMLRAAAKLERVRGGGEARPTGIATGELDAALRAEPPALAGGSIDARQLADGLFNPAQTLLRERLGLRLQDKSVVEAQDREPLDLDDLQKWKVRDAVLRQQVYGGEGREVQAVARRLRAEGALPLGAHGEARVLEVADVAGRIGALMREQLGAPADEGASTVEEFSLQLALHVDGRSWAVGSGAAQVAPDPLFPGARMLLFAIASAASVKHKLRAWLQLLVAAAGAARDGPLSGALFVARPERKHSPPASLWLKAPPAEEAKELLRELVRLWLQSRTCRLPLFPDLSFELAEKVAGSMLPWSRLEPEQRAGARALVASRWSSDSRWASHAGDEVRVAALWGTPDADEVLPEPAGEGAPDPEWIAAARTVYGPLLAAAGSVKDRAGTPAGGAA